MQTIDPAHRAVLIRLTKSFPASEEGSPRFAAALYDATRRWWKIAASRTSRGPGSPAYAFAVHRGVVQAVYSIDGWTRSPDGTRFGFDGSPNDELFALYGGAGVSHYFPPGAANPIRFVNCSAVAGVGATPEELATPSPRTDAERADYIDDLARQVMGEPLAHIMFGGRELFHSNLLRWFALAMPAKASDVFDGLYVDPEELVHEGQGYVARAERERGKLDLAIWWDDSRSSLVIENKVFSLPDFSQLDRYSQTILDDPELSTPRQILLSLQDPEWDEDTFDTADRVRRGGSWHRVSYGTLGGRIIEALKDEPTSYDVDLMRHYGVMVIALQNLADAVVVQSSSEPVLLTDTIDLGTTLSIDKSLLLSLTKLRARSVQHVVQADLNRCGLPGDVDSGFSNGTPVISMFCTPGVAEEKERVGWQLQGRDFRMCAVLERRSGSSDSKRESRIEWGVANPRYFDFDIVDQALESNALKEYPPKLLSAGGFNRYDPDFIYRAKKLPAITVGQLLDAARRVAAAHTAPQSEDRTGSSNADHEYSDERIISVEFEFDALVDTDVLRTLLMVGGVLHLLEQPARPEHGPIAAMKSVYGRVMKFEANRTGTRAILSTEATGHGGDIRAQIAHRTAALVRQLASSQHNRAQVFDAVVRNADPGAFERYRELRAVLNALPALRSATVHDPLRGFVYAVPTAFDSVVPTPVQRLTDLDESTWEQLESLVSRCRDHVGPYGEWVAPVQQPDGSWTVGYPTTIQLFDEVFHFIYDAGFVLRDFDWSSWDHGRALLENKEFQYLPADSALGLVTMIARQDRFSEGTLMGAFDDGTMQALLRAILQFRPERSRA